MAGQIKDLPLAAARRARADQKRYAEAYLPKRGKGIHAPLKVARFLVEVCGLSLRDATWAVRRDLERGDDQSWQPQGESEAEMARKLHRATGDIFEPNFGGWSRIASPCGVAVRLLRAGSGRV
jgi:hypothetical protein